MVIAVDIRLSDSYQHFIFEAFKRITAQHPRHSFLFIFDKPFNSAFIFSENVTTEVIKQTRIQLLAKLNNENKISSLLKKYKADIFITEQPIKTNVPQCFVAYDKIMASYLKKAKVIVSGSEYSKEQIAENYKINKDKIEVVYQGADDMFRPLKSEEREKIKEGYADGNEYFLVGATIETNILLNVLKAFSVFKKMQKSNMLLLIAAQKEIDKEFLEKLELFKYKSEVKIVKEDKHQTAQIIAASYAFLHPSPEEYPYALQAMKCDIPVIAADDSTLREILTTAGLYANPNDHKQVAEKMMLVYKDEKLRNNLIEKGRQQVKKYSWDETANAFWRSIEKGGK